MTIPEIIVLLEGASTEDDKAFPRIVQTCLEVLEITDEEVCRRFDMSRPSAKRWREGRNLPHPAMRKPVFAWFLAKAKVAKAMAEAQS